MRSMWWDRSADTADSDVVQTGVPSLRQLT
jgi:hypothetical protein